MSQNEKFDVVVIGGGITGAGIFFQSVCAGLKTLLLEATDYSFGTTSKTGKLVHGGFRYLQQGQLGVSYHSVKERELLIKRSENLVGRIPFYYLTNESKKFINAQNIFSMNLYHLFAGEFGYRRIKNDEIKTEIGVEQNSKIQKGLQFSEGFTDDSRLNLRLIFDGIQLGGEARNYSRVIKLLKTLDGRHCGVVVESVSEEENSGIYEVYSKVIINATGIWMDDVCRDLGVEKRIRRQRGSHLILPFSKLPLKCGVMFNHPVDNRIQFAIPWYNRIVFGTTDLDEGKKSYEITDEPGISENELDYLLFSINNKFPDVNINFSDVISTFCGIRPIIRNDSSGPYASSRRHQIWDDNGMISIAGGKLTTFQYMAYEALKKTQRYIGKKVRPDIEHVFINKSIPDSHTQFLDAISYSSIKQKYGRNSVAFFDQLESRTALDTNIQDSPFTLADIRWAACNEMVKHLDDLFLRRTRLGLILEGGGVDLLVTIKDEIMGDLSWDERRWNKELIRYKNIWKEKYFLPE